MIGNHFEIKINNSSKRISEFNEYEKILNFFGYQRFGSKRPITHLVGKAIIQKNYQAALDLLLNYSSEYDTKENNANRKIIAQRTTELSIIDKIPKSMDIEIAFTQLFLLFVLALKIPVMGHPIFQGFSIKPKRWCWYLPYHWNPTRAWDWEKQTFLVPRPILF